MLERSRAYLADHGVEPSDIVRIDVPGRGAASEQEGTDRTVRSEVEPAIPLLQSGSLFGGRQGLEVVDAQHLHVGEAEVIADLLRAMGPDAAVVVLVSEGKLAAPLKKVVAEVGETTEVRKIWESNAQRWLQSEVSARGLDLGGEAVAALIQRFGADTASLGQALDQLADTRGRITAETILDRFKNRPNEPIFHYTDAVTKGDTAEALRRLTDQLVHQHPLVLLAALESEVRRRAIALSAPDKETFAEMMGARARDKWVDRVWRQRSRLRDSSLRKAMDALVRADRVLKSAPEELHRVTMERLTLAMSRWMVGR